MPEFGGGFGRRTAQPILVTGMPRSGTTWLARLVATSPGGALAGREPMNPGRHQYRLARTVDGWRELTEPQPRQRRALRRAYRGRTPWVFSRYGRRQWAAPWPGSRLVIKDPFAMLSLPAVSAITGAAPVLLYRHAGAALVSYRRMGWQPDLEELRPIVERHVWAGPQSCRVDVPRPGEVGEAEAMARFWAALYAIALDNAARVPGLLIVSHEELAAAGVPAARLLFEALGLRWNPAAEAEFQVRAGAGAGAPVVGPQLHEFGRAPSEVASQWRASLEPTEIDAVSAISAPILQRLGELRLRLSG